MLDLHRTAAAGAFRRYHDACRPAGHVAPARGFPRGSRELQLCRYPGRPIGRRSAGAGPSRQALAGEAGMTLQQVRRVLLSFPGVEEGPCYGTPGFRVRGKFLARLKEDGTTLVVKCGDDERDFRMQADPTTFFTTAHYRGYPTVLVRLTRVRAADLRDILEQAWRRSAPKRLIAEYENRGAGTKRRA